MLTKVWGLCKARLAVAVRLRLRLYEHSILQLGGARQFSTPSSVNNLCELPYREVSFRVRVRKLDGCLIRMYKEIGKLMRLFLDVGTVGRNSSEDLLKEIFSGVRLAST